MTVARAALISSQLPTPRADQPFHPISNLHKVRIFADRFDLKGEDVTSLCRETLP